MPELPGRLEQHRRALDVGPREGRPIRDATPSELLAGKVDSSVDRRGQSFDHRPVADVALDQRESPVFTDVVQVRPGARPSERVQDCDQNLGVGPEPVPNERRPQKSGATSDQKVANPELAH